MTISPKIDYYNLNRPRTPTTPTAAPEVGEVRLPTAPVPKKEIFRPKKPVEVVKPKPVSKPQKVISYSGTCSLGKLRKLGARVGNIANIHMVLSISSLHFERDTLMELHALKNVNICLNTNIYSYLETYGGQSVIHI